MNINPVTPHKKSLISLALALMVNPAVWADSQGEPGREAGKANPLKNVYFGEEHMHTRNSFDAFTIGVNQTWEQAYDYAKGKIVDGISLQIEKKKGLYGEAAVGPHVGL